MKETLMIQYLATCQKKCSNNKLHVRDENDHTSRSWKPITGYKEYNKIFRY